MERWHYALALAACVAVTLPLEFGLGARVYRRPWLVVRTLLPVMAVFLTWDLVAHRRGVWWFDDGHILGPRLFGLPAEEWLFFVVVPLCVLLAYEAVGAVLRHGWSGANRRAPVRPATRTEAGHG